MKKLLLTFMLLIFLSSSAVSEDGETALKPETGNLDEGLTIEDVVNGAVGPFDSYCDGYGNPGASGLGYISVLTLEIGTVTSDMDEGLEEIVAYDRAEADGTYIGQINMITASSFNGINGAVWGYHIAKAEAIANNTLQPLFMKKRSDGTEIPVYSVQPLLDAGKRLLGIDRQRRFPLLPGAHVRCAVKSNTVKGPTFVWCAIALAIAEDRSTAANLFIEDAGHSVSLQSEEDRAIFLDRLYRNIAESIIRCGDDQKVQYKEIFVGAKIEEVPEGHVGCALTCAPYVVLARKVVPAGEKPEVLLNLTLSEWEETIGLSPLAGNPDKVSHQVYPKVFGNRIPKDYFVTAGRGDTDIGPGDDPWETGSYDLALMEAGIANFNVMQYTSVLPPESREVPIAEAEKWFHHGAVIEVIMASVNGVKGNTLSTGVGRIQVRRKSDGKHIGGFAAEYKKVHQNKISAEEAEKTAKEMLHISLMGEFNRRYSSDEYEFFDETHKVNSFKVEKKYGTSLVALCWVNYIYP